MPDFNRLQRIQLNWTYPIYLECIDDSNYADSFGVYMITRVFGDNESLIYIGQTKRTFKKRIWEHLNKDFSAWTKKRGTIKIRFAEVAKEGFEQDKLLESVESALIGWAVDNGITSLTNTQKTQSAEVYYKLHIFNKGCHFRLPSEIYFEPNFS